MKKESKYIWTYEAKKIRVTTKERNILFKAYKIMHKKGYQLTAFK